MKNAAKRIKFNRGHFPSGTVAIVHVDHQPPKQITVLRVVSSEPDNWIIETDEHSVITGCNNGYNIEWVTGIVKRGDGAMCISSDSKIPKFNIDPEYDIFCEKYSKTKNDYMFKNISFFIRQILHNDVRYSHLKEDHLVNLHAVTDEMKKHGSTKKINEYQTLFTINKKKFHKRLAQLIARNKLQRKNEQRALDDEMRKMYEKDMEDDCNSHFGL